jgi:N-hydroxyarylamine O-acetyltransferase
MASMNTESYLSRIGLDAARVRTADLETLERLQRAHVTTVPFETLSITGDPFGPLDGEGVSLVLPDLYEKIVERRRGGYCFELNGLFGWLLGELGFDADRIAARVVGSDGEPGTPAGHHANLVSLDRTFLVDVGFGPPQFRRPIPLDGTTLSDDVGVEWRVVESDRPDADYEAQSRTPDEDEWSDRYVLDASPRKLTYFEATCDYFSTAPESAFTGDPIVHVGTDRGHKKLSPETLTRVERGEKREREVGEDEWHDVLESEFGLEFGSA